MKGKTGKPAMRGGGIARKGVGAALKGGGLARKGVGMALKGGGIARKGTGSNATPGGKEAKMAMGGTPPMGGVAVTRTPPTTPNPNTGIVPPGMGNIAPIPGRMPAAPGTTPRPGSGEWGRGRGGDFGDNRRNRGDGGAGFGGLPFTGNVPAGSSPLNGTMPNGLSGIFGSPMPGNFPTTKPAIGVTKTMATGPATGPAATLEAVGRANPPGYYKKGGKVKAYAKGGQVKMTAGAGSGSGRLEKVEAHKKATRVPAAGLKKGGKVKLAAEELKEFKRGKYMGGPKEEAAEKKGKK